MTTVFELSTISSSAWKAETSVGKVLKLQTKLVENQIDAFSSRLHAAASATDFRNLVDSQIRLIPEHASRFVGDARETLSVIAGAGQEFGALLKGTVAELRDTAKPAARKTASKKTTVKKTTARQTAPKKSTAKKTAAPKVARTAAAAPKAA